MKKEIKETKKSLSLTISIMVFLALIFGAAYALINSNIIYDGSNVTAALGSRPIFVSDASNQITLEIPYLSVEADEEYVLSNGTGSVDISLSTNYEEYTQCTYDIYWQWDQTSETKNQYKITSGATKEYTISGTDGKDSFTDVQLNDYNASNLKTLLHSGYIVASAGSLATQKWNITAKFYKTQAIQSAHAGANYSGKVVVENVLCNKMSSISDTVLALESSRDYTSSQDGTLYRIKEEKVIGSGGTVYDAGVRYEGKNPDNYVIYNNEEWRIIGVFDGSDIGLDPSKKYTKIIRSSAFNTLYAWDDENGAYDSGIDEHDWYNSTLKNMLNSDYLNGTGAFVSTATDKGLNAEAKGQIAQYNDKYSTWYLKGPTGSAYESMYSQDWYLSERYTGTAGYRNDVAGDADPSIEAAIGIMYPSDYGFAAYSSTCDNRSTMELYNYDGGCAEVDWLLSSGDHEWLISPYAEYPYSTFYMRAKDGGYVFVSSVIGKGSIRPTLYLESDVVVSSGDGSEESPYKLYKEYTPTLSEEVISKLSSSDYTSSQDGTPYRVANQNGIRYEGADPDNYVTYNDEEWRIIGVFDGADIGLESGKKYTKIIRSSVFNTTYKLDKSEDYQADWTAASLNTTLNTNYLNQTGDFTSTSTDRGLGEEARGMIAQYNNYSKWYLGGIDSNNYTDSSNEYYIQERDNVGYGGTTDITKLSTYAAIGLMYPSDYGYAMYGGKSETNCINTSTNLYGYSDFGYFSCNQYNWLFHKTSSYEWLLSPLSSDRSSGMCVTNDGAIVSNSEDLSRYIRPTLYLESSILAVDGDGSKEEPYIL